MVAKIGALLTEAIHRIDVAATVEASMANAARVGGNSETGEIPVVIALPRAKPKTGESWSNYKNRVETYLNPIRDRLNDAGIMSDSLISANALSANISPNVVSIIQQIAGIDLIELDPLVQATNMDDALDHIEHQNMRLNHPTLDGSGVKVAVLDSGIDVNHPFLNVSSSVETCGESTAIPGSHGTHCAGSIASTDSMFAGVAPGVTLINIKVLRANGTGQHTFITKGVDEALNRGAHILSMSLGFNHLPKWSHKGHGWTCSNGRCPLCTSVDNASLFDNTIVVVAAGNEHQRAENLRTLGFGNSFDTELGCPGQAREAITVAAITKQTSKIASFSSHGPTAYGLNKVTIAAPGVNITSTIPVPRDPMGMPISNPTRSFIFGKKNGTSMATPIVAGAAALLIQQKMSNGIKWTPSIIRQELMTTCAAVLSIPANQVGAGSLTLDNL